MAEPPYPEWHRNNKEMPTPPGLPHLFRGKVYIHGKQAPAGTVIYGVVDSWDESKKHLGLRTRGSTTTDETGSYGLTVPKEGIYSNYDGDRVRLYVGDKMAVEHELVSGGITDLDLRLRGEEPEFEWVKDSEVVKSTKFLQVEGKAVLAEVDIPAEAVVGENTAKITVRNDGEKDTLRLIVEMDGSPLVDCESVVDAGATWEIPFGFVMPRRDVEWRIRAFHREEITVIEKSRWVVTEALKDYPVNLKYALDLTYFLAGEEKMRKIIETDWTDRKEYVRARFDCENYAFSFKAHVDRIYGLNQVGVVLDFGSGHAYNIIVFPDATFKIFEPQTDTLIKPEERDTKIYQFGEKAVVLI